MITVDRRQFSRAIKLASAVVEKRQTIPILAGLKLTANGSLTIEGSDLDNFMRVEMPYEGDAAEMHLPEPRGVASAINAAGSKTVEIGLGEESRMSIKSGEFYAELRSLPADDHPATERVVEQLFGSTIGAAELAQIRRVMAAISTEETRYYLNGVNVKKVGDWTYRFAATDGHRLMMVDIPMPDATGDLPDEIIIPRRFLNVALASFGKPGDGLAFKIGRCAKSNKRDKSLVNTPQGKPRVSLSGETGGSKLEITGKLIDGTYPDYSRVIPAESAHFARFQRADLAQAINALTPLSTEKTRAVRLSFPKGKMRCELHSPVHGKSGFVLAAEHDLPKDFVLGVNGQYMLDMCAALAGDEMQFGLNDAVSPITITDPADTAFKAVQMPMRA